MFCSGDLALRDSELITLERLNFNRIVAIAILIMRGNFAYRGQDNSDTSITKAIPRNIEGGWKSALLQGSTGSEDISGRCVLSDRYFFSKRVDL